MDDVAGPIADSTTGGMTGNAPDARSSPILVGSSTAAELNNVRLPLVPVAILTSPTTPTSAKRLRRFSPMSILNKI